MNNIYFSNTKINNRNYVLIMKDGQIDRRTQQGHKLFKIIFKTQILKKLKKCAKVGFFFI